MAVFHDEVEIEDFEFDEENELYHYPCPCGDRFEISKFSVFTLCIWKTATTHYKRLHHFPAKRGDPKIYKAMNRLEMLEMGEDVATCPSCSLIVRVIYDPELFVQMETLSISATAQTVTEPP